MGYVHVEVELKNPRRPQSKPLETKAIVDTRALMPCIPDHVALQLELEENRKREVTTSDGSHHKVSYVGPIDVIFENRNCFVGALVMGDKVLLGAVPMEDMDLIISPSHGKLVVNPESLNFPHALVK